MDKSEYIRQIANLLAGTKTSMNAQDLMNLLNWNMFPTDRGTRFGSVTSVYTLIQST